MRKSIFKLFIPMTILMISLTGCSSLKNEMIEAMNNHVGNINMTVAENSYDTERAKFDWIELDQLNTHRTLRQTWDDTLNVIRFDVSSKNGPIFVDTTGNWSGNNTLYSVFQNKVFVTEYWNDSKTRSNLAKAAIDEFSDIQNESTGIMATVNAYFNLIPTNEDGTSGMYNYLTRAEVMSAIYRGDTPVVLVDENKQFTDSVGESPYNIYAQEVADISYLDYTNESLNNTTYNSTMTRAEAIYMIVQRFYADEYNSLTGKETGLSDCKNAGRVADKNGFTDGYAWQAYELEYCLQNPDKGLTEDLYKALIVAKNHNIISSESRWSSGILGGELIQMLIDAYDGLYADNQYLANAKVGANAGKSLVVEKEEAEPVIGSEEIPANVTVQKIKDISDIDKLLAVYGNEIDMTDEEIAEAKRNAEGYTIEPVDKYMLVDFCSYLNVRVGPSTDFDIKKSVPKETKVHIVGRCAENGWYRVIADGKISYQCGVYFSDLEGQDTSNLVQEYETEEDDSDAESVEAIDSAEGQSNESESTENTDGTESNEEADTESESDSSEDSEENTEPESVDLF